MRVRGGGGGGSCAGGSIRSGSGADGVGARPASPTTPAAAQPRPSGRTGRRRAARAQEREPGVCETTGLALLGGRGRDGGLSGAARRGRRRGGRRGARRARSSARSFALPVEPGPQGRPPPSRRLPAQRATSAVGPLPYDQVDKAWISMESIGGERKRLERVLAGLQSDRRRVDEQIGLRGQARRRRRPPSSAQSRSARSRRAVPDPHLGGAGLTQRPDHGARAAAGAEHERASGPAGSNGSASIRPGRVGVVGVDRAVAANVERVGGADRARGVGRLVGERERRLLVRDRHVGAREAGARQRRARSPRTARAAPAAAGSASRRARARRSAASCIAGERLCAHRPAEHAADRHQRLSTSSGDLPPAASRAWL